MRGALGRVPSRNDPRTLRLANYLKPGKYSAPPPARDWIGATKFSWFLNSRLGTCTCAALGHMLQAHVALTGKDLNITDDDILKMYRQISGYDPAIPGSDRGAQMIDALKYVKNIGLGGYKIGAFVRVDPQDPVEMRAAVNLFGGVYVGADMPNRVVSQVVWDLPPPEERDAKDKPGSMGGHAFTLLKYDRLHWGLATWATTYAATNAWVDLYVDEAWAIVSPSWVTGSEPAPNGFDIDRLLGDLAAI